MLNPMQMLGMMSNVKNPQQMIMNIAKQNPQMNMAMQMMGGVKDKKGNEKDDGECMQRKGNQPWRCNQYIQSANRYEHQIMMLIYKHIITIT